MSLQVLSLLVAVSLLGCTSCNNIPIRTNGATSSWQFPVFGEASETRIGRQMPPQPEPDAVLINAGPSGQPTIPEGGYPQFPGGPGIFNTPRDPGVFGFPRPGGDPSGVNPRPGVFGIPQDPGVFGFPRPGGDPGVNLRPGVFGMPQEPGVYGIPRLPGFPDTFGVPGFHVIPRNPGYQPDVYGASGMSRGPRMFVTSQTQLVPFMPKGPNGFTTRVGQSRPGFTVRTRTVGASQPGEQTMHGQRGVFAVAGSGNIPFYGNPGMFFPGQGPSRFPGSFFPRPDGQFPGVFYPEAPTVPNQPGGRTPNRDFPRSDGGGGREVNDDPIAEPFPLMDRPPTFFKVPS